MSGINFQQNDDDDGNFLPSVPMTNSYSSKRRGWDGDHLELNREQPSENLASHVAVNLGQFRNEQIGVGYQAKHVIRQRYVPDTSVAVHDMTLDTTSRIRTQTKHRQEKLRDVTTKSMPVTRLQKYLNCEGMRNFRKELASIESSI